MRLYPLNLQYQMKYASLLNAMGENEQAKQPAGIVSRISENDKMVIMARSILGEKVDSEIKNIGELDDDRYTLVLVPIGDINIALVRDLQKKLKAKLGIEVFVRNLTELEIAPPKRDPFGELAKKAKDALDQLRERNPQGFGDMVAREFPISRKLPTDDNEAVVKFLCTYMGEALLNPIAAQRVYMAAARARQTPRQWDAGELVRALKVAAEPHQAAKVRFLGITGKDIYTRNYKYLFGWRVGRYGVISYRRFTAEFTGERPRRSRLVLRAYCQAMASAGHVFNVARCNDPTCPRAYVNSLAEQNAKTENLCHQCTTGFDRAFRRLKHPHRSRVDATSRSPTSRPATLYPGI
ncbi:MAG TPA: hypothetical protein ENH84_02805 [Phycisphaerae bacterium]|nr:hypothetical protein [Phycisphaerae bacterium]